MYKHTTQCPLVHVHTQLTVYRTLTPCPVSSLLLDVLGERIQLACRGLSTFMSPAVPSPPCVVAVVSVMPHAALDAS